MSALPRSHRLRLPTALVLSMGLASAACTRPAPAPTTVASAAPALVAAAEAPTLVYLVRHAEKALEQGPDPVLTDEGTARARALAALLGHAGVTHLYATEYQRTSLTLAPLAEGLHLPVTTMPAKARDDQLDALRALPPGSVAVVAGHSNTIPPMARALGAAARDLDDAHYDRLLVVALSRTGTTTRATGSELRFGAPSPD